MTRKEYMRAYYLKHRAEILAADKAKRKAKLPAARYASNRAKKMRERGITQWEYDFMARIQDGKCAVCLQPPKVNTVLCIDHDHQSNQVRGLLCRRCNAAIGLLEDDPNKLLRAFAYLRVIPVSAP